MAAKAEQDFSNGMRLMETGKMTMAVPFFTTVVEDMPPKCAPPAQEFWEERCEGGLQMASGKCHARTARGETPVRWICFPLRTVLGSAGAQAPCWGAGPSLSLHQLSTLKQLNISMTVLVKTWIVRLPRESVDGQTLAWSSVW